MVIKVGCCGYRVSKAKYHEALPVVELKSIFYRYPRNSTVERWRNESPPDFEFTVKANREISHQHKLKIDPSAEAFDTMKRICRTLEAKVMLIHTPGSFTPDYLEDAYEFLGLLRRVFSPWFGRRGAIHGRRQWYAAN